MTRYLLMALALLIGCSATTPTSPTPQVTVTAVDLANALTCYIDVLQVAPATRKRVLSCSRAVVALQQRAGQPVDPAVAAEVRLCAAELDMLQASGAALLPGCSALVQGF